MNDILRILASLLRTKVTNIQKEANKEPNCILRYSLSNVVCRQHWWRVRVKNFPWDYPSPLRTVYRDLCMYEVAIRWLTWGLFIFCGKQKTTAPPPTPNDRKPAERVSQNYVSSQETYVIACAFEVFCFHIFFFTPPGTQSAFFNTDANCKSHGMHYTSAVTSKSRSDIFTSQMKLTYFEKSPQNTTQRPGRLGVRRDCLAKGWLKNAAETSVLPPVRPFGVYPKENVSRFFF